MRSGGEALLVLARNERARENGAASTSNDACSSSTEGDNCGRQLFRAEEHAGDSCAALRGKLRIDLFFESRRQANERARVVAPEAGGGTGQPRVQHAGGQDAGRTASHGRRRVVRLKILAEPGCGGE